MLIRFIIIYISQWLWLDEYLTISSSSCSTFRTHSFVSWVWQIHIQPVYANAHDERISLIINRYNDSTRKWCWIFSIQVLYSSWKLCLPFFLRFRTIKLNKLHLSYIYRACFILRHSLQKLRLWYFYIVICLQLPIITNVTGRLYCYYTKFWNRFNCFAHDFSVLLRLSTRYEQNRLKRLSWNLHLNVRHEWFYPFNYWQVGIAELTDDFFNSHN